MYVWISTWLGKYLRKTHSEDNFCFLCDFLSISWRHPVDFCIWEGSAFFELEIYKYKFLPCKQILFDRLLLAGFLFFVATVAFYYCVPTPGIFVYYDNWIFTEWKTKLGGCFEAKQVRVPIGGGTCLLIGIGTLGYQKKKKREEEKEKNDSARPVSMTCEYSLWIHPIVPGILGIEYCNFLCVLAVSCLPEFECSLLFWSAVCGEIE